MEYYEEPDELSDDTIEAAAVIAIEYNLPVKDVAQVIETNRAVPVPAASEAREIARIAQPLRAAIAGLDDPICQLQRTMMGDGLNRLRWTPSLIPVVAGAVAPFRFDAVLCVARLLQELARYAAAFGAAEGELDVRQAMIVSKMATAGYYWWDAHDEFPFGEFEMTAGGLVPTIDSGTEFIARIVDATDPDVTMGEMAACLPAMRDAIGMTGCLAELAAEEAAEKAEREAKRAHLKVVK